MTERTSLSGHNESDSKAEQAVPEESFVCDRCFSTWPTLYRRENGSELFRIEKSANDLSLSSCRVCRVLAGVMREHLERDPTFQRPLLQWDNTGSGTGLVTFHYGNNDSSKRLSVKFDSQRHQWHIGGQWLPMDYWRLDARLSEQQRPGRVNFPLIKQWLHICQESHGKCMQSEQITLRDFRLVDCNSRAIIPAPTKCLFVALSYVWGASTAGADVINGLLARNLPRTIEESILATQLLGYQYLWIDKFCIEQDDANDKHLQIQQMGAIYEAAQVTLIASAGRDPSYGLPGVRGTRRSYRSDHYHNTVNLLRDVPSMSTPAYYHAARSTWSTRAWTFQEGYLSRRRLYFTDTATLLVCNQTHHGDPLEMSDGGFETLTGSIMPLHIDSQQGHLLEAMKVLQEYSTRHLRYNSDALNAVAGVLDRIRTGGAVDSIWGTPFSIVPTNERCRLCILWHHLTRATRRSGFPSWSPLGWRGHVQFHSVSHQYSLRGTELYDIRKNSDSTAYQQRSLELNITATILKVPSSCIGYDRCDYFRISVREIPSGEKKHAEMRLYMDQRTEKHEIDSPLLCAFTDQFPVPLRKIYEMSALLVRKHGDAYERIGFATCRGVLDTGFSDRRYWYQYQYRYGPYDSSPKHISYMPWLRDEKPQTITLI